MPGVGLSVAISPHTAAASRVLITLSASYEMQCGWPGPGPLTVRFPPGMLLPARFAAGSAIVNGKPVTPSRAKGAVLVPLAKRPQIMCDAIGPGRLTVTFTRGARIGTPKTAGSYPVRATHGSDTLTGRFTVTR